MNKDSKGFLFILFFILLLTPIAQALIECKGTITNEEVPCYIFLPINTISNECNNVTVGFYNRSILLFNQEMDQFNGFNCNSTFNISSLGTFNFNYSTGDSGSITVEEGNMNFFNILVYLIFAAIILTFIVFMHIFKDSSGSSIVYGWIATALNVIIGSMILSPNFQVVKGISFFIDVDIYLAILHFVIAMYTALVSINIKRQLTPSDDSE